MGARHAGLAENDQSDAGMLMLAVVPAEVSPQEWSGVLQALETSPFAVMELGVSSVMEPVSGEGNGHPGGVKSACF